MRNAHRILVGIPEDKRLSGALTGRMISKRILKRLSMKIWTGFSRGSGSGLL
jgi:hypothetical protein